LSDQLTKSSLSKSQRQLLELMQTINFGRIECLQVRGGEPVFIPAPRIIRKLKIGAENGARPEINQDDFWLKHQHVELFQSLVELGDGEVLSIDIRYGLAFALEVECRPFSDGGRCD
jgi:hypothetical protein